MNWSTPKSAKCTGYTDDMGGPREVLLHLIYLSFLLAAKLIMRVPGGCEVWSAKVDKQGLTDDWYELVTWALTRLVGR